VSLADNACAAARFWFVANVRSVSVFFSDPLSG
jgi:hypothetical protein